MRAEAASRYTTAIGEARATADASVIDEVRIAFRESNAATVPR